MIRSGRYLFVSILFTKASFGELAQGMILHNAEAEIEDTRQSTISRRHSALEQFRRASKIAQLSGSSYIFSTLSADEIAELHKTQDEFAEAHEALKNKAIDEAWKAYCEARNRHPDAIDLLREAAINQQVEAIEFLVSIGFSVWSAYLHLVTELYFCPPGPVLFGAARRAHWRTLRRMNDFHKQLHLVSFILPLFKKEVASGIETEIHSVADFAKLPESAQRKLRILEAVSKKFAVSDSQVPLQAVHQVFTSQDLRDEIEARHILNYVEHRHLLKCLNPLIPWALKTFQYRLNKTPDPELNEPLSRVELILYDEDAARRRRDFLRRKPLEEACPHIQNWAWSVLTRNNQARWVARRSRRRAISVIQAYWRACMRRRTEI